MLCLPELLYSVTLTLRHVTVDPYLCGDSWTLFNRMKQVRKRKTNIVCWRTYMEPRDFLSGSDSKESACSAGDPGLILGSGRFPWRKEWQSTLVFLPEEFHGQRNLARYNPCGRKESDMTDWATHTCTHTYTHTHTHIQTESRKMILMNLSAKQHSRHRNMAQTCGHNRGMREWDKLRE